MLKVKNLLCGILAALCLAGIGDAIPAHKTAAAEKTVGFGGGNGFTQDTAIEISTPEQLFLLSENVNSGNTFKGKFIRLTENIDLSAYGKGSPSDKGWTSIGYWTASFDRTFDGVFDGNQKTITGLYLNSTTGAVADTNDKGLFGYIGKTGTVKNLTVKSAEVISSSYTGIICGTNLGVVLNCRTDGKVVGDEETGGVAGQNLGLIINANSSANVEGRSKAGGIVGSNKTESTGVGEIKECAFTGSVAGLPGQIGGIAGRNTSVIQNVTSSLSPAIGDGASAAETNKDKIAVLYDYQGGGDRAAVRYYEKGEKVALPNASRKGSALTGWFETPYGGEKIKAFTAEENYQTLYAHWENAKYTVHFELGGGSLSEGTLNDKIYNYNDFYGALPSAQKKGYQFMGWFDAPEYGNQITGETVVSIAENHTIYAVYKPLNFTVTFETNGGGEIAPMRKPCGTKLYEPDPPVKEGYVFCGWYTDEKYTNKYEFTAAPDEDITLYAKWEKAGGKGCNSALACSASVWFCGAVLGLTCLAGVLLGKKRR